jgi:hypothetical protein
MVPSDYASINRAGATSPGTTGVTPSQYVSISQGFIVHKTTVGSGTVTFKNSMRNIHSSHFYKEKEEPIQRFMLSVTNPDGMYNETLIAFLSDATDGFDPLYDGLKMSGNPDLGLYSLMNADKYSIQSFNTNFTTKSVNIGLNAGISGKYILSAASLENIPNTLKIYLEDKENGTWTDLKANPKYEIQITSGQVINTRFVIHFKVNNAPVAANGVPKQTAYDDSEYDYVFNSDVFNDQDLSDKLKYSISMADGSSAPKWMKFKSEERRFKGTPTDINVGNYLLKLTAKDNSGDSAYTFFELEVLDVNDPPYLTIQIPDTTIKTNENYIFSFDANTFIDCDKDDYLTYSATLNNGNSLPVWLNFDAINRTFYGIPGDNSTGKYKIILKAEDTHGAQTSTNFEIQVQATTQINEVEAPAISIYPNPNKGQFEVRLNEKGQHRVTVTDITGKVIYQNQFDSQEFKIDLGNVHNAVYFIKIQNEKDTYHVSFVVE